MKLTPEPSMQILKLGNEIYELQGWEPPSPQGRGGTLPKQSGHGGMPPKTVRKRLPTSPTGEVDHDF
jgi:hypothetical protein